MFKRCILVIFIILFFMPFIYSKNKKKFITKKDQDNYVSISIDEVVFEEDDYMKVFDHEKKIIIKYDWFEHRKCAFLKNARIYDEKNNLLMTLVYIYKESGSYQIHYKTKDDIQGVIKVSMEAFFDITFNFDINYHKEGYEMEYVVEPGFVTEKIGRLYLNDELVIFFKKEIDNMGANEKIQFLLEKNFLKDNREDAGFWIMIFIMIV